MSLDLFKVYSHLVRNLLTATARHIHGHNAGAMKNHTTPPGYYPLNGFTGLGMFFQGLILHFLHNFKALGLRAFFFRNGLVNIRGHNNVFA